MSLMLKFMFSKKATKIDEIFTVDLTLCVKSTVKIFVAFLENTNFKPYIDRGFTNLWTILKAYSNNLFSFIPFLSDMGPKEVLYS